MEGKARVKLCNVSVFRTAEQHVMSYKCSCERDWKKGIGREGMRVRMLILFIYLFYLFLLYSNGSGGSRGGGGGTGGTCPPPPPPSFV